MWRNCYYDARTSSIIEYTWDKHGERETVINKFKPFLLVETERETPIKSIYGTSLVKKEFDNSYQRYKFADEHDGRIFFNLKPEQQYLIGKYRREEMSKFMEHDVRVFFLDIECPSRDEFPKPDEAKYEIDILTIYDSLDGKYHMWGKHPYDKSNIKTEMSKLSEGKKDCKLEIIKQEDIIYYEIFDEKERLEAFVTYWENNFPDIYTGWNCIPINSNIFTKNGIVKLQEIYIGQQLCDSDVVDVFPRSSKNITNITLANGCVLKSSNDHIFPVGEIKNKKYVSTKPLQQNTTWSDKAVKDIDMSYTNFVEIPLHKNTQNDLECISDDQLYVLGFIYTDGSLKKTKTYTNGFNLYQSDYELLESFDNILETAISGNADKGYCRFCKYSILGEHINLIYKDFNKTLNVEGLSKLSRRQWLIFLSGMLDGDGYISTNTYELCNYSDNGIDDIYTLMIYNGIFCTKRSNAIRIIKGVNTNELSLRKTKRWGDFESKMLNRGSKSKASNTLYKYDESNNSMWVKIIDINQTDEYVVMQDIKTSTGYFNYNGVRTHNCDGFDTPYIMNRLQLVLGKNQHLRLSPVNKVYTREFIDQFQNPQVSYNIRGISSMDYMEVYKIFTFGAERGSWSLDSVASDVLNCGKIDYEHGNLWDLSKKDWDTYSAYNLVDVGLIVSIEKELSFLEVGRATAYEGYTNFTDCLGKVVTITGSIAKSSLDAGKILETRKPSENTTFEGGYVKQPDAKLRTNIATYDVTSLYPTNMMALGVSLETKIGKVTDRYDNSVFYTINGSMGRKSEDEFLPWLKKMNYCISPADIIFDQGIEGVVNEFVKKQFNNKSEFKKLEKKAYAEGDMEKVKEYHRLGQITKIFLNSCYGVISAASSPLFDLDIARSITLTGQYSIRKAAQLADEFARDNFDCKSEIVIGGDTDSIFCDFSEIVENKGKAMFQDDKLTDFGDKLCKVYERVLNEGVNKWASEELCCNNPTFNFEREKAAETALFFAKKQYAYYVLNNEGNDLPVDKRMKYTGLKVVQSGFSPQVKRFFHELYFVTLTQFLKRGSASCRTMVVDLVKRHKDAFMAGGFFDVSKRAKANNLIKWENEFIDRYTAGPSCPIQTKACILHNRLVEDLNLKGKYPELLAGTKAMWVYVKPNKYGFNAIAGNMGVLPPEFELEIDYEKQWEKLYLEVSEQLFRTVKWRFPNLFHDEMVDLDDLFM